MEYAKLLKTTISANYLWQGDRVYITTKWQSCKNASFAGKVQINFEFGTQRQFESSYNSYSYDWNIYPHMYMWEKGSVYETAGHIIFRRYGEVQDMCMYRFWTMPAIPYRS